MARPLLLLDVDGVLALQGSAPAGYIEYTLTSSTGESHHVWLNSDHGAWITVLSERFEIVWATGWEHDAPRLLGDLLGVPGFPVLEFTERPRLRSRFSKLAEVIALAGDRSVAWVDDDFRREDIAWAAERAEPTLLVQPATNRGLEMEHVNDLIDFADALNRR